MFIKIIPQSHCLIVERFGKPVRVAHSGLNFFIPFIDGVKNVSLDWNTSTNKNGIFIELTEQINDTQPRQYITKDNVTIEVDCVYRWRITDPMKAVYEVDNLHKSLKEAVLNEIRSVVGSYELNEILARRDQISDEVVASVSETVKRWGINVIGAEIQELKTDESTQDAMRKQLEAARTSEALKVEAEGKAEATIKEARAESEAIIIKGKAQKEYLELLAEGEQTYIKVLSESLGKEKAAEVLIAQKTLQTYSEITKNPANKVYMPFPNNTSAMIDSLTK